MTSRRWPALACAILATALVPGAAGAAPQCDYATSSWPGSSPWTGRVCSVGDGDTFVFNLDGVSSHRRVRITGLNATEKNGAKATCHSAWATERIAELIAGADLTLRARNPEAMSGDRYWRWVDKGDADVAVILLREGLALAEPFGRDPGRNDRYIRAAQIGARDRTTGRSLWNPTACAVGPKQDHPLKVYVQWNADGTDEFSPNGEFVRIHNDGPTDVSLDGWWVRDSATKYYYFFPPRASVPAGGDVVVKMGRGDDTNKKFYAGFGAVFMDTRADGKGGDGAYLFDPDGDLRAAMQYPCVVDCSDPARGDLALRVRTTGDEFIRIRNIGTRAIDLGDYVLEAGYWTYTFWGHGVSSILRPGEAMEVHTADGGNSRLRRHWGRPGILGSGGTAFVRTWDAIRVACVDWGSARC